MNVLKPKTTTNVKRDSDSVSVLHNKIINLTFQSDFYLLTDCLKAAKWLTDYISRYSCIDIYAHSCLKQFTIGRKPCSNSKTHVRIMKFMCRLNMGFGRRHWSM